MNILDGYMNSFELALEGFKTFIAMILLAGMIWIGVVETFDLIIFIRQ